ncbi:hypothetical protein OBBRIDRAFT_764065 [Obba rivulosa]|uniref:Protein BIG1 n=1 Tax=Obba rivulosa TaxID=1052685 RepID=A0A8E2DFA7_9APHY|nr:hypothetical protein OBBRIDRAFT_764065 [Obba rivulosa]
MTRRMMHILFALLPAAAFAFSDTIPLLAWSSQSSDAIPSPQLSASTYSTAVLESVLFRDDVCKNDAVIVVEQPGLHASDLRTLSSSSFLANSLESSPSALQLPYVLHRRENARPLSDLAAMLARRCGSQLVELPSDEGFEISADSQDKYVVYVKMPGLDGAQGQERKELVAEHEFHLASTLRRLTGSFPQHFVVYTGSSAPRLVSRQSPAAAASPSGGILARYQLLTPGLILALLVAFFVLIPTVFFGVTALASVQSPVKTEPPKGFSADAKKTQ